MVKVKLPKAAYLWMDQNQIWACTTRSLGEHPRQVSKKSSGLGDVITRKCLRQTYGQTVPSDRWMDRQSPLWDSYSRPNKVFKVFGTFIIN